MVEASHRVKEGKLIKLSKWTIKVLELCLINFYIAPSSFIFQCFELIIAARVDGEEAGEQARQVVKVLRSFVVNLDEAANFRSTDDQNLIIAWLGVDVHLVRLLWKAEINKAKIFHNISTTYIGV